MVTLEQLKAGARSMVQTRQQPAAAVTLEQLKEGARAIRQTLPAQTEAGTVANPEWYEEYQAMKEAEANRQQYLDTIKNNMFSPALLQPQSWLEEQRAEVATNSMYSPALMQPEGWRERRQEQAEANQSRIAAIQAMLPGEAAAGNADRVAELEAELAQLQQAQTRNEYSAGAALNTLAGAAKQYGAGFVNVLGDIAQLGGASEREEELTRLNAQIQNPDLTAAERAQIQSRINILNANPGTDNEVRQPQYYEAADRLAAAGALDIEQAKQGQGKFGQTLIDVGSGAAQLGADIAAGALTGGSILLPMAIRSYGSASQEARENGASYGESVLTGLASAALSALTEKLSGVGVERLFGVTGGLDGIINKGINMAVERFGKTAGGKAALDAVLSVLGAGVGEGLEEGAEAILQPLVQRIYDEQALDQYATAEFWADAAYDALVGGLVGAVAGGAQQVGEYGQNKAGYEAQQKAAPEREAVKTPYTEQQANQIRKEAKTFRNIVAGIDTSISEFFARWKGGRKSHAGEKLEKLYLGRASADVLAQVSKIVGYDVGERDFIITNDDVKHIYDHHGDPVKEQSKGNLPLDTISFDVLSDVVANPTNIYEGDLEHGKEGDRRGIVFEKTLPDGTVVYVQFDNTDRQTLQGRTLYIKPAVSATPTVNTPSGANTFTSKTTGPAASTGSGPIVSQNGPVVKSGETSNDGTLPEGMGAAKRGFTGDTVRGFSENIATDEAMEAELREDYKLDPEMYHRLANKDTLAKAEEIFKQGLAKAQEVVQTALGAAEAGQKLAPEMVPLARMVANALTRKGDIDTARNILSRTAIQLTEAGQLGQAANILRNTDHSFVERTIQAAVDRINQSVPKNQKWRAELTKAEIGRIWETDVSDADAVRALYEDIAKRIGREMPATVWEKLSEIRRIAMLLNPKTQIKNVLGNVPTWLERKGAETLSGAIQSAAVKLGIMDKADQTRTARVSKESKELAKQQYQKYKDALAGNKYDMNSLLRKYRKYFSGSMGTDTTLKAGLNKAGAAADAVREFTYNLLELGDTPFVQSAFVNSLSQIIQAQGVTNESQITDRMIEFATDNALRATFKQVNALAKVINQAKSKGGIGGKALDILFPFTTTPLNLATTFAEYSPLGFFKLASDIAKGKDSATIIDDISKTTVGTTAVSLGFLLRSLGAITGSGDDDRDKRAWDEANGIGAYSVGGRWSYNWAQPAGSQLAMGADIYAAIQDNDSLLETIMDAVFAAGDAYLNTTFFQNIIDIFNGYESSPTEAGLTEILTSGVGQMYPSLFGAIARTVDDTVRSTKTGEGAMADAIAGLAAKTPGASQNLPASIDARGEEKKRVENVIGRAAQEFLDPGNLTLGRSTEADELIRGVYEATGKNTIFPTSKAPTKADDGTVLTGREVEAYEKTLGQTYYDIVGNLVGSNFDSLTPAQQAEVLEQVNEYAGYVAKRQLAESRGQVYKESDWDDEYEMDAATLADYLVGKRAFSYAKSGKDVDTFDELMELWDSFGSEAQAAMLDMSGFEDYKAVADADIDLEWYNEAKATHNGIKEGKRPDYDLIAELVDEWVNMSTEQQQTIQDQWQGSSSYNALYDMLEAGEAGFDAEQWLQFAQTCRDTTTIKDEEGNTVETKQEQLVAYIDSLPVSAAEKDWLYLTQYTDAKLDEAPWH